MKGEPRLALTDDRRVTKECAACLALLVHELEERKNLAKATCRKEEHAERLVLKASSQMRASSILLPRRTHRQDVNNHACMHMSGKNAI